MHCMMTPRTEKASSAPPPWGIFPAAVPSFLRDLPIILAGLAIFYGLLTFSRYGIGPVNTQAEIQLHPGALPKYALFSLTRIAIAYVLSLAFTFVYGYIAAYNAKAERFMIPLLDTLQSIPVLSFLPAVMVSMVALFPTRQLGVELGCIVLIFTGQVWNMTFSFYSSLKSIPNEMREAAKVYRLSWWQRFMQMELPYAAIGLIWNSMMSVAGAWFFLMACEMFVLGNRDLRLPGLGSYLQTAANAGDTRAIVWGLAAMVAVIVLVDQIIWRPTIAWAEKFKFEQVEAAVTPRSPVLDLLRRSKILPLAARMSVLPLREALNLHFARAQASPSRNHLGRGLVKWILRALLVGGLLGVAYAVGKMSGDARGALATGNTRNPVGSRSDIPSSRGDSPAGGMLDDPGRALYRVKAEALRRRPTDRSNCSLRTRHGFVPHRSASADPRSAADWELARLFSCCWVRSGTSCSMLSPGPAPFRRTSRKCAACSAWATSSAGANCFCPESFPT